MARAKRNHAAEQQRRNALAQARGYRNRSEQRGSIARGESLALRPRAMRNIDNMMAQARLEETRRDRAYDWSSAHAKRYEATYLPDEAEELDVTEGQYTTAYLEAFVDGPTRYTKVRHTGGSRPLFHWYVEVLGFYTIEEYEARYGPITW